MKIRHIFLFLIAGLFIGKSCIDLIDGESNLLGKELLTRAERKENPTDYWNNVVLNGAIGFGVFTLANFFRKNYTNT